jgi:hypothetical protein
MGGARFLQAGLDFTRSSVHRPNGSSDHIVLQADARFVEAYECDAKRDIFG